MGFEAMPSEEEGPVIKRIIGGNRKKQSSGELAATLYFDGGCRGRQGCGGFALFTPDGELIEGIGEWYGEEA